MVSLTGKLVRALVFAAGCSVAGVMIVPSCTHRRCDVVRRGCGEECFYRCDRSGCYPVCGIRCRNYCYYYGSSATVYDPLTGEDTSRTPADPGPETPEGGTCEYHDDCRSDLSCVEHEGKEGRACEPKPENLVAPPS